MRAPLLRMVLAARSRGEIVVVHSDKEAGVEALEPDLLKLGVTLRTTQGRDPQANGLAEQAVGQLARMARAAVAPYSKKVAADLWQEAMVWSAQRLVDPKLPPFGAMMLVRHPPLAAIDKLSARAAPAVFLNMSTRTTGAAHVGMMGGSGLVRGTADRRTVRAALDAGGAWQFPDITAVQKETRGRRGGGRGGGVVAECDSDDADAEPHWLTEDDASAGDDVPLSVVREWMLAGAGDDAPLSVARD